MKGTFTGPGGTGRSIDISGHEMLEFDSDHLITSARGYFDEQEYNRQLFH